MPSLRNCEKREAISIGLADNLQKLELDRVSKSALYSSRKIEEAKKFKEGAETSKRSGSKLCIGPADRA